MLPYCIVYYCHPMENDGILQSWMDANGAVLMTTTSSRDIIVCSRC